MPRILTQREGFLPARSWSHNGAIQTVLNIALLALGLAILFAGGEALVRGATGLARSLGVSALTVGLTVVAFGTSAPELALDLTAVLRGSGDLAFGNLVGANIANVGLVLAVAALVRPRPASSRARNSWSTARCSSRAAGA